MLEPLAVRIHAARRAAAARRLAEVGMTEPDAERWLSAWESHADAAGVDRDRDYWRHGFDWIQTERPSR